MDFAYGKVVTWTWRAGFGRFAGDCPKDWR